MNFRPRTVPALLFLMLALSLSGCGKSPEEHFQQGKAMLEKGDNQGAIVELKNTLQQQPNNGAARFLLGKSYMAMESYAEAEKELRRAREMGEAEEQVIPLLAKAHLKMGEDQKVLELGIPPGSLDRQSLAALQSIRAEALLRLGKQADAEQAIAAAEEADAKQPDLLFLKARQALGKQQGSQAMAMLDDALKQRPKFTDALYLKAALLQSEDKTDAARQVYQRIIANDPRQFRAHLAIFGQHLQAKKTEAAEQELQAAEKIAANNLMVRHARGIFELEQGKLGRASSALLDLLRVAPDHLPANLAYAMASYGLGHYEQSLKSAQKVLAAVPENLIANKILAGSRTKIGDTKGALKVIEPLLSKHPDDAGLLALAGETYLQARDYAKAQGYLDKAASLDPENIAIRTRQAAGLLATGDSKEAIANLEKAASLSNKPGEADLALVMLHLRDKEFDKALQAIKALEKKLPTNPVTHNLRAAALAGKQDRLGARDALEQALAVQPTFFPAAVNLARLDMQDKKPEAARKRFEAILAQDKANVGAMMALADLAQAQKKENEHVEWLEKAVKADPKALPAHAALIRHHLGKKENAKALTQARQAAGANPESLAALNTLGATQLATGDIGASINTYTNMTRKAPQAPGTHLLLAMAQTANGQLDAARASLKQALQIKPDFLKAQDALIRLELTDKKPDAALALARQIQAQQPKSPVGFAREGDIHVSQKRHDQAIKAYEQALAKGDETAGLIKLHRALYLSGNTKGAEQRLTAWIKQRPDDPLARTYAAEVYMQIKRNREAIAQYEALLKIKPDAALALNNLANLYQREKDTRALATAERAIKLAPDHPAIQDTLGWILVEQGQLPRALELLAKAAANAERNPSVRYHHGVALARSGKKAEAKKELAAALDLGRAFPEQEEAKALLKGL